MKKVKLNKCLLFKTMVFSLIAGQPSYSQNRCEKLFLHSKPETFESVYENILFGEANRLTELLNDQLENRSRLNSKQIKTLARGLEKLTESYLQESKIEYTKSIRSTEIKNLLDQTSMILYYDVYILHGSPNGNSLSRQVHALNLLQKKSNIKSAVIFDPLYQYNHPSFSAHFSPSWRKSSTIIKVGPQIIKEYSEGFYRTFRHEMQHYIEFQKISDGKMTLARVTLEGKKTNESDPYSTYLSCDEAETYLRDLRFTRSRINKILTDNRISSNNYELNELGKVETEIKNRLNELIDRSLSAHNEIIKNIKSKKISTISKSKLRLGLSEHKIYDSISVDISKSNKSPAQMSIETILLWNKQRLLQIQSFINQVN